MSGGKHITLSQRDIWVLVHAHLLSTVVVGNLVFWWLTLQ